MANTKTGADAKTTTIEEGTEFRGSLTSNCPIVVKGRFDGDVNAPLLTVTASGAVAGRTTVGELRSSGELGGEFDTDTAVLAGTVKNNTVVRTKSLEVKLAAQTGRVQLVFETLGAADNGLPNKP
jgi:cytoskeletal protein CcmA (bactofilin family)